MVGCGDIASVHVAAVHGLPGSELVGVCDSDPRRRAEGAELARAPGFASLAELLDAARPDVVHICTPHHLHADMAIQCLARDVSVLVEKPLAHSLADGERLAMAAEDCTASGRAVLGVCFQNRYNDTARRLRELLDGGTLGRPLGGRASVSWFRDAAYYADRDWRGRWATAGGGVLMNQAIHTLDLLQWYLGPVTDVRGVAATLRRPGTGLGGVIEVEDTAMMRLHHRTPAGEITSVFHATNGDVENAPVTVEIVTERARVRLDTDLTVEHDDGHVETVRPAATGGAVGPASAGRGERGYWGVSHAELIADFHHHVRARLTPERRGFWLDAAVGLETLQIIDAVYEQSPGLRP